MIQTYYWCTETPPPVERDHRGVKIEAGLRVAYNRSGNVVYGTIVEIVKNLWITKSQRPSQMCNFILDFRLKVVGEDGKESLIKNPNSFIII